MPHELVLAWSISPTMLGHCNLDRGSPARCDEHRCDLKAPGRIAGHAVRSSAPPYVDTKSETREVITPGAAVVQDDMMCTAAHHSTARASAITVSTARTRSLKSRWFRKNLRVQFCNAQISSKTTSQVWVQPQA